MTQEEIIKIVYNSSSTASCPKSMNCENLIETDLGETDYCWNCAEGLLNEYENTIYNKAFDDLIDCLQADHSVHEEQLKHIRNVAEQLKKGTEE